MESYVYALCMMQLVAISSLSHLLKRVRVISSFIKVLLDSRHLIAYRYCIISKRKTEGLLFDIPLPNHI